MDKQLIELLNFYMKIIREKSVFLELRVNPEAPIVEIIGVGFRFRWAGNNYFRASGLKITNTMTSDEALKYIERYVENEAAQEVRE